MPSQNYRKEFLQIIGRSYKQYGYPEYCGWIEGLLNLEMHELTQRDISEKLAEIFPESKYPTSISSVNRALKILETYGVVEKDGSRKEGYSYRSVPAAGLVTSMLQQLLYVNEQYIIELEALSSKKLGKDKNLREAITYQRDGAKTWNTAVEQILGQFSEHEEGVEQ